jgi:hypothetical protein
MRVEHYALIGGFVLIAVLLWSQNCPDCQAKYGAITGAQGAFPGAGSGVEVR